MNKRMRIKISQQKHWAWLCIPLSVMLWHLPDIFASVGATGDRWLFYWYFLLGGACLAFTAAGAGLYLRQNGPEPGKLFLITVLSLGVLYTIVLPPLSAPDEVSHYITAYDLSSRMLGQKSEGENGKFQIRASEAWLEDVTDQRPDDGSDGGKTAVVLGHTLTEDTYAKIWENMGNKNGIHDTAYSYQADVRTTPVAYLPQAVGFAAARILGLGSLELLWCGRLMNLVFFALCGAWTIKHLPFGKEIFFGVSLLPMNLHLVSSLSYDVLLLGLGGCFTALCLELTYVKERTEWKDIALLSLFMACMGPCKMVYGLMAGLCLLIPVRKFGGFRRWILSALSVAGAYCAAMLMVNRGTVASYTQAGESYIDWAGETGYTLAELIHRPFYVIRLCYNTIAWQGEHLFTGMLGGNLGNLDPVLNTPFVLLIAFAAILLLVSVREKGEKVYMSLGHKVWIWVLSLVILGALMFSMLLAWTPRNAVMIQGVQGRYLLPLLPALLMTVRSHSLEIVPGKRKGFLFGMVILNIWVLLRLFAVVCLRIS